MDLSRDTLIVGMAAAAVIFWQWPTIQSNQAKQSASVAEAKVQMAEQDRMTANKIVLDESAKCAEDRYKTGVDIVSNLDGLLAVPIQEGQPIVAGAYAKRYKKAISDPGFNRKGIATFYVGRDVSVGDAYGTTAITKYDSKRGYSVASDICVTPKRSLMANAVKQRPGLQRPGTGQ